MVERENLTRIKLVAVDDDRKKDTLQTVKKLSAKEDSKIFPDFWASYKNLQKGYNDHKTQNHSEGFKNETDGTHEYN